MELCGCNCEVSRRDIYLSELGYTYIRKSRLLKIQGFSFMESGNRKCHSTLVCIYIIIRKSCLNKNCLNIYSLK